MNHPLCYTPILTKHQYNPPKFPVVFSSTTAEKAEDGTQPSRLLHLFTPGPFPRIGRGNLYGLVVEEGTTEGRGMVEKISASEFWG